MRIHGNYISSIVTKSLVILLEGTGFKSKYYSHLVASATDSEFLMNQRVGVMQLYFFPYTPVKFNPLSWTYRKPRLMMHVLRITCLYMDKNMETITKFLFINVNDISMIIVQGNILLYNTLDTFYLWLYGIKHMVNDQSDSERGTLLPPLHGILFLISSNHSFICTINIG